MVSTSDADVLSGTARPVYLYHYLIHPRFGFMYTRLQTWFPFQRQVGINGREWLSRQLEHASIGFQRRDNAFTWLEDPRRAQQLMHQQLTLAWPRHLGALAHTVNPALADVLAPTERAPAYYWSAYQSEWATDVMFRDADTLARLYPKLIHHGITHFGSRDVLRFLGHKLNADGHIPAHFHGEVTSDLRHRPEGVRIKHRVNANSVKLYDKPTDFVIFLTKTHGATTLFLIAAGPDRGR